MISVVSCRNVYVDSKIAPGLKLLHLQVTPLTDSVGKF